MTLALLVHNKTDFLPLDKASMDIDAKFLRENEILELQVRTIARLSIALGSKSLKHELKNSRHEEERLKISISVGVKPTLFLLNYCKMQEGTIHRNQQQLQEFRFSMALGFGLV